MSTILNYEQFLKEVPKPDIFSEKIPKLIFKTGKWELTELPKEILKVLVDLENLNPFHKLVYFSDNDCIKFIENFFPEYKPFYDKLIPTAYKADLFRYLLLFKYGGCYGDITQKLNVPYDELCCDYDRVFCRDTMSNKLFLYNALMCCKPLDSVVAKVIELSIDNIKNNNYSDTPLGITGPAVLGQSFISVFKNSTKKNKINLKENNNSLILDFRDNQIYNDLKLQTIGQPKIKGHEELLYDTKNIHYRFLWVKNKVFLV